MLRILFSPNWFYNYDILFDIVSAAVTLILAAYVSKIYRYTKEERYRFFSLSFLLIALGFVAKSLTNFGIYEPVEMTRQIGLVMVSYTASQYSNLPFVLGFFLYRFFQLLGLSGLFLVLFRYHGRKELLYVIGLFILLVCIYSWSAYFIFHIVALLILLFIFLEYWRMYRKRHKTNTFWIAASFLGILISQLLFIFVFAATTFYAVAETLQLIGYGILAYVYYRIVLRA